MSRQKVKKKVFPLLSFTDANGVKWVAKFYEKRKKWKTGKNTHREKIIINKIVYVKDQD